MATADKLKKYVTAIADAIREKEGSTELINPQDFADRIKGLEVGEASGSSLRYFKTELAYNNANILGCLQRFHVDGQVVIVPTTIAMELFPEELYDKSKCVAFAFDTSMRMYMDGEWKTVDEEARITKYCEEITEEQFYDLNTLLTPQEITFTVKHEMNPVEYTALDGMTWEEFCNSDYNSGGDWGSGTVFFEVAGDSIFLSSSGMGLNNLVLNDNTLVKPTDTIINGGAYKMNGLQ